jgi:hypothetical protein
MKKNAIITCCDANCADFLVNHWLKSLIANVNLTAIEVIVIDYGLSNKHLAILRKNRVKIIKCVRDSHPAIARNRDLSRIIDESKYNQVLCCDSADIIFQGDLNKLFSTNVRHIRAVCEGFAPPLEKILSKNLFSKEDASKILKVVKRKREINAGFLIGPAREMKKLFADTYAMIREKKFFADQIAINYFLYKKGFVEIPEKFNFALSTSTLDCVVKNGIFYQENGDEILVLHNCGSRVAYLVKDFGFGPTRNKIRLFRYGLVRLFFKTVSLFR